jgi:flagellar hook-basal body complex protein FliE
MISPITSIPQISVPQVAQATSPDASAGGFQSVLEGIVGRVDRSQTQAQQATESFLAGGNEELHSVALAAQRASLEFELFLQVRNKVTSAYQEIMRMQV